MTDTSPYTDDHAAAGAASPEHAPRTFSRLYQRASADIIVRRDINLVTPTNRDKPRHRILVATDMHARNDWFPAPNVQRLVDVINAVEDVDSVVLVGDFVGNDATAIDWSAPIYGQIEARTFATLGNHDHWTDAPRIESALTDSGIEVLTNRNLERADGLWFAGIDSCWGGTADPELALAGIPEGVRTVVLGHEPKLATYHEEFLHIAGHTHAGQVRLPIPWLGLALTRLYMPLHSQPYPRRLYRRGNDSYVYTSAGVGYSTLSWRLTTPPEIVVIDI